MAIPNDYVEISPGVYVSPKVSRPQSVGDVSLETIYENASKRYQEDLASPGVPMSLDQQPVRGSGVTPSQNEGMSQIPPVQAGPGQGQWAGQGQGQGQGQQERFPWMNATRAMALSEILGGLDTLGGIGQKRMQGQSLGTPNMYRGQVNVQPNNGQVSLMQLMQAIAGQRGR